MSRKTARENLFKAVYESCVNHERGDFTLSLILSSAFDDDAKYIESTYNGIEENYDYLLQLIIKDSKSFSADRIYKVDLAILLISVYEILFDKDIPDEVSINEALELSKIYSTENSYKFINGILARIIRIKETNKNERGDN